MIGQRVIIIEDDHPIRQLMSALLEMEGFRVRRQVDGNQYVIH